MAFDATDFKVDPLLITEPRARLEYLRDFLRGLPEERFNMGRFFSATDGRYVESSKELHECGTAACIAGWAVFLFRAQPTSHETGRGGGAAHVGRKAAALLDVNDQSLFFPWRARHSEDVTPAQAADVLDHLIRTGEVDWSVARAEP